MQRNELYKIVPKRSHAKIETMAQLANGEIVSIEANNGIKYLRLYGEATVTEWLINNDAYKLLIFADEKIALFQLQADQIFVHIYDAKNATKTSFCLPQYEKKKPLEIIDVVTQNDKFILAYRFATDDQWNAMLVVASQTSGEAIMTLRNLRSDNLQVRAGASDTHFYYISNGSVQLKQIEMGNKKESFYNTRSPHRCYFDVMPNKHNHILVVDDNGIGVSKIKADGLTKHIAGKSFMHEDGLRKISVYNTFSTSSNTTEFDGIKIINDHLLLTWQKNVIYIWSYGASSSPSLQSYMECKFPFNQTNAYERADKSILLSNGMLLLIAPNNEFTRDQGLLGHYFHLKPASTPKFELDFLKTPRRQHICKLSEREAALVSVTTNGLFIKICDKYGDGDQKFHPRIGADIPVEVINSFSNQNFLLIAYKLQDATIRLEALATNLYRVSSVILEAKTLEIKSIHDNVVEYVADGKRNFRDIVDNMTETKKVDDPFEYSIEEENVRSCRLI